MTKKEFEAILLAAGWAVSREQTFYRTWMYPGTRMITDVWNEDRCPPTASLVYWLKANENNLAAIPRDMLLPKEIADVLKHCC